MPRKVQIEDEERRAKVQGLFFQGYTQKEIVDKLRVPRRVVASDLKLVRLNLDRRETLKLQYRKNKCLSKIELIQKLAWDMIEKHKARPATVASFGRLINASQELEAKVQGVIAEKMVGGTDEAIIELQKEFVALWKKDEGNGQKEVRNETVDKLNAE